MNYSGLHDSAVAVLDGSAGVRFAVAEERLSGVKKDGRFPSRALALAQTFAPRRTFIAYPEKAQQPLDSDSLFEGILEPAGRPVNPAPVAWTDRVRQLPGSLRFLDHHISHAAAGYFLSGFERATVLVIDDGAWNSAGLGGLYAGSPSAIEPRHLISYSKFQSPCSAYSAVTAILGFVPCKHEGKVTGLAGGGRLTDDCRAALGSVIASADASPMPLFEWAGFLAEPTPPMMATNPVAVARCRAALNHYSNHDLAAVAQERLESQVLRILERASDTLDVSTLVLAGGAFANVALNRKIKEAGVSRLFVCPPMGDEGLAIGAAYLGWLGSDQPMSRPEAPNSMYLGQELASADVDRALAELGVDASPSDLSNSCTSAAKALASGRTVAIVRGREEFGPRALGHRSVFAPATDPAINDSLNAKLRRSEFMPFAPVTRAEWAGECFRGGGDGVEGCLRYMTICVPATLEFARRCPAVVHVDGTCRPQVVSREDDPFVYDLLGRYRELTGIPAVINTSFNTHDRPIVSNAEDAILGSFQCDLDALVLGDRFVDCRHQQVWPGLSRLLRRRDDEFDNPGVRQEMLRMFISYAEEVLAKSQLP